MKGYVYVMSNKAMDGILKIGYSTKDPSLRAKELSSAGVPFKFKVEYEILVDNPESVEGKAHSLLRQYKVNKEWFDTSIEICIEAIKKSYSGNIYYEKNYKNFHGELIRKQEVINMNVQQADIPYCDLFDATLSNIDSEYGGMNLHELNNYLISIGYPNHFDENNEFIAKNAYENKCVERVLLLKQIKMIIDSMSENCIGSSTLYNMLEKRRGLQFRTDLKFKGKLAPWVSLVNGPRLREYVANFSDYLHVYIIGTKICKS